MSNELIDVLNDKGLRTGEVMSRTAIHRLGKIHRAVHLYLFDFHNNILLQKRSAAVDHYPNMYSISVTGHIDAGESSKIAVKRETQEELGLDANRMDIISLFSYRNDAVISPQYIDKQFNDVYACIHDFTLQDVTNNCPAITDFLLMPVDEFTQKLNANDSEIVPAYKEPFKDVLYFMKPLLENRFSQGK